jgi:hypothetical protein
MPDEWQEKVSPVIMFPRLITKSQLLQNAVIFKKLTGAKKPSHFENASAGFLVQKITK